VWNSWGLTYDSKTLEDYVNRIKPAHTKTIFTYFTQKHAQFRWNTTDDWNACTLTDLIVNDSGGLTLDGNTSGTAETPVLHVANMSAWDTFELDQSLSGNTLTVEMRSSATGVAGTFSAYETLSAGLIPTATPIRDYVQFKVSISTVSLSAKPILNAFYLNCLHT
jgi:hypothetical protein